MKYLLVSLFTIWSSSIFGQNQRADCRILQEAINTEKFKSRFYICQDDEAISIVDTSHAFDNCVISNTCNKKISLYHDYGNLEKKRLIEIYRMDRKKKVYTIYFHRPFTGAALIMKLKVRKGKVRVLGYKEGAF